MFTEDPKTGTDNQTEPRKAKRRKPGRPKGSKDRRPRKLSKRRTRRAKRRAVSPSVELIVGSVESQPHRDRVCVWLDGKLAHEVKTAAFRTGATMPLLVRSVLCKAFGLPDPISEALSSGQRWVG